MAGGQPRQEPDSSPHAVWFVLALLCVLILQILYGLAVFRLWGPDMATRGQFGDIFGGINALFTGLAFAGVIYTILLQRQELGLQRYELEQTRHELALSAKAQSEQVVQLKESARLAALTALLNMNNAKLAPLREMQKEPMRNLAAKRLDRLLNWQDWTPEMRLGYEEAIEFIENEIADLNSDFRDELAEQEEIVRQLRALRDRESSFGDSPAG